MNVADGNARVGVQAHDVEGGIAYTTVVLGGTHFTVSSSAPAEQKYQVGLNNLASGMVTKARELIWDAMMEGPPTYEMRFHWLVAMLGGRTVTQFSSEELNRLKIARKQHHAADGDPWVDGVQFVFRLLESVGSLPVTPKPETSTVLKEFDSLGARQRDMLLPHLDLFLTGSLKDDMWRRERGSAEAGRLGNGRKSRAWMFFQPIPIGPRVLKVQPPSTTLAQWLRAWAGTATLAAVAAYVAVWELLRHGLVLGLVVYVIALTGGAFAWRKGLELRFLIKRRHAEDERLQPPRSSAPRPPRDGFADQVDALFRKYSAKYVPDRTERDAWEAATAGIRKIDRDEIVTVYREASIPAERTAWLIRYRIRQSRDRWRRGRLYDYRDQLRPEFSTVIVFSAGTAVAVIGGATVIVMLWVHPVAAVVGLVANLLSGVWAWRSWCHIDLERRRYGADTEESALRLAESEAEFARWTGVLAGRPADAEVEAWLDCDRTALLGQAMDHYKLSRSRVLTHAFLHEPGAGARSARVRNGPMRYSRYKIIVFLLTSDGVRQMTAELSFVGVTIRHLERISYRYDAVASAYVSVASHASDGPRIQQRLKLTLVNGDPISLVVTDLNPGDFEQEEDVDSLSRATLDAASVANTLHVLEGIAAEGKGWFQERMTG